MTRTDAIAGTFMFLAILAWVAVTFLGFVLWLRKQLVKRGWIEDGHESVQDTLALMDEHDYHHTRNARQDRRYM